MARLSSLSCKTKTGIEVVLRSPKVGEGAAVLDSMRRVMETSPHVLTAPEEFKYTAEEEDEIIGRYLDDPTGIMIVPYIDEKPIGMLNFQTGKKKRNAHRGELGMSLLPQWRGNGIGVHMLKTLIDWAKIRSGIEKIELRVHARNASAIALYQKLGFVIEGKEVKGVKFSEGCYDDVFQMALFVK